MPTIHIEATRFLKSLRNALVQNKKPLGLLISAGCPLAVKDASGSSLIPDMKGLSSRVFDELKDTGIKYQDLLNELELAGKNKDNLEDILSFVRSLQLVCAGSSNIRGFTESELNTLEKEICRIICEKVSKRLENQDTPYHILAQWISSIDRERPVEIFTTNYDLLLEQALEETQVPYFDGFCGSREPFFDLKAVEENLIPKHWTCLWKIHGSVNWIMTAGDKISRATGNASSSSVQPLIYPSHLKYDQSRKMPYLALLDRLSGFLKKSNAILVICGYSFNDHHINDTIVNALKANPNAVVFALQYGSLYEEVNDNSKPCRYNEALKIAKGQHNLNLWTSDFAIIGTNEIRWRIPTDPKAFFKYSPIGSDDLLKIGDFNEFTEFLKSLIGEDETTLE
ncbi:SIR2 family protein [uncultured Alistipes sp.]|jgi:hypothetical protein|uniref:SIR2 family protein n=1 Tax=uncultured Alistipes sp. TaxID=538949 RepID=UPI0025E0D72C|nr:SIR2 family protein [uncultured Alistipes sp.]